VTLSLKSRALLPGAVLAALAVVLVRFTYPRAKEASEARGGMLLDYHPGLLFDAMVLAGIVCFVAALISLFMDFHSSR
jgi:hypothetical protein